MLSVPLIIQGHDGLLQPYRLNMGNSTTLCPASPREAENTESHVRVHEYLFPMYVVKVSDFLQMEGAPEPHHVLKEKGLLHEWRPGMFAARTQRLEHELTNPPCRSCMPTSS
jgi:hypothetical protein